MKTELFRLSNISNSVNGEPILKDINLSVFQGEILAILGLNDSGKTTLVDVFTGEKIINHGRILLFDNPISIHTPAQARKFGVHCIRQETKFVNHFSIAENLFVIREKQNRKLFIDFKEIYIQTKILLTQFGIEHEPNTITAKLSQLEIHLLEIIKATTENARLIIMDNILDEYSPKEMQRIHKLLSLLVKQGVSFLLTSRKIDVVLEIANRVSILRDGTIIRNFYDDEFSKLTMTKLLVGRNPKHIHINKYLEADKIAITIQNLYSGNLIKNLNLVISSGEIFSIFDMEGEYTKELSLILSGSISPDRGIIKVGGQKVLLSNFRNAVLQGVVVIPETWYENIIPYLKLIDNLALAAYSKLCNCFLFINNRMAKYSINTFQQAFNFTYSNTDDNAISIIDQVNSFKIILYRWLMRKPKVIIMIRPFQNIDLLARNDLYKYLEVLSKEGITIVLVTADLSEATAISDRVMIIQERKNRGIYTHYDAQNNILAEIG